MSTTARYRIGALAREGDMLRIEWSDRHVSLYPAAWLLEACNCDLCGSSETAVRHLRLIDKPARPGIASFEHDAAQLYIDWDEAHRSRYDLTWLRSMCLSPRERRARKFRPQTWGGEMASRLPWMDYTQLAASTEAHLEFLESILHHGFAILRGAPAAREKTAEIASLVGKLRLTNYGIYELESRQDPEIVGDMALPLAPHTGEPYRVDPPAITFFHVISQSDDGGESTLLDGFRLAALLRERNPAAFDTLSRVPAHFHRSLREGRLFEYHGPVIQLDSDGDLGAVRLLDRGMAPVDCALDEVEPFYRALREFLALAYDGEGIIEFRLEAGDILVFNNQRLMHGRNGFDASKSKRHVRSCSVDLDEFYSRLRILYRERNDPRRWMIFRKH